MVQSWWNNIGMVLQTWCYHLLLGAAPKARSTQILSPTHIAAPWLVISHTLVVASICPFKTRYRKFWSLYSFPLCLSLHALSAPPVFLSGCRPHSRLDVSQEEQLSRPSTPRSSDWIAACSSTNTGYAETQKTVVAVFFPWKTLFLTLQDRQQSLSRDFGRAVVSVFYADAFIDSLCFLPLSHSSYSPMWVVYSPAITVWI